MTISRFSMWKQSAFLKFLYLLLIFTIAQSCSHTKNKWYRGNMHTHSFWSDGDTFPEFVAQWYKENDYHFMVFTEGNTILEGERWQEFPGDNPVVRNYVEVFGEPWVEMRMSSDDDMALQVRLKTLDEFRSFYEEPGRFLLIMGNEISNAHAVHLLAFQQDRIIRELNGSIDDREKMLRQTVEDISNYRKETGKNVHAVLTHPNYNWAITAEMILSVPELRFFEVYNGHPSVRNEGDELRPGTDRLWDIVLSNRLA